MTITIKLLVVATLIVGELVAFFFLSRRLAGRGALLPVLAATQVISVAIVAVVLFVIVP